MINLKKLSTAIATSAVLVSVMAPGAFASTIDVSGNGAFSRNMVDYSSSNTTSLNQSNNTSVSNNVDVSNDTGGNSSSFNTGGSSNISTGGAYSNVTISNEGGTNVATLPSCGCSTQGTDIFLHGNGAFSDNNVTANTSNRTYLNQNNTSNFSNDVNVSSTTGNNQGSFNTSGWNTFGFPSNWSNMSQGDLWNWYSQHMGNNPWDQNQFNNWFNTMHNQLSSGNSQLSTGNATSNVEIHNMGSTNVLQ